MANKTKKSSFKLIMDLVTILLGGLLLGFVALPHVSYEASSGIIGGGVSTSSSGYDLINFEEGANTGVAVVLLLIVIFASLLVLFGLLKLLTDSGTVKSSVASKVMNFGLVICALALTALVIANIFTVSNACSAVDGGSFFQAGSYAVWATLIVNAILGVGSLVTSLFAWKK